MKASSVSPINIALIKYWGKRDQDLILPYNNSISMTVDGLYTRTTVDFGEQYEKDTFILNNKKVEVDSVEYKKYIGRFLSIVRDKYGVDLKVKIMSENNFPTSAGLASSASGFSALSTAINSALNLGLNSRELSVLSRLGSGSSSRSIYDGFVEWKKGEMDDGSDSYAEQIIEDWPSFRMVICITDEKEKKIKSRAGMAQSVSTSPMYGGWLSSIDRDLNSMRNGLMEKNFSVVGRIAEENCLKMHAVMMTTKPSIIYWNDITLKIIKSIIDWRENGLESYFTIDAGSQVKIICMEKNMGKIIENCKKIKGIKDIIIAKPGKGSKITNKHLF